MLALAIESVRASLSQFFSAYQDINSSEFWKLSWALLDGGNHSHESSFRECGIRHSYEVLFESSACRVERTIVAFDDTLKIW